MTRHLSTTSSQATHNQSSSYPQVQRPSGEQGNPRFISQRSNSVKIYPRRKTDNHESDFRCSSISHQPFYLLRMLERYTLSTTRFPSQSFGETGCDYFLFPMPGKKDHITIDPEILSPYFTPSKVTNLYSAYMASPAKKTTSAIIEVKIDKSHQFQVNQLNIA